MKKIGILLGAFNSQTNTNAKAQNGLAYIVGDTNTTGSILAVGAFVYVKGHATIPEGLRKVTASLSVNGSITTNNTEACSEGGLNVLNSNIATQSATVAKANANYTFGNVTFEKTANSVRVMIEGFISLPAKGYTDICAIPTGFAPNGKKYFDVLVGTNESGANLRIIRFMINRTTLSAYNYSTELSNENAQPIIMYIR